MLTSTTRRLLLAAGAAAFALPVLIAANASAATPTPIGHDQLFSGVVNGHENSATIYTDCASTSGYGHPVYGQTVEVTPASSAGGIDVGNTGDAGMIDVLLNSAAATNVVAYLTSYNAPARISDAITVPCSGTGTATFFPIPFDPPPTLIAGMNITYTPQP
jgi:hypothetical protein